MKCFPRLVYIFYKDYKINLFSDSSPPWSIPTDLCSPLSSGQSWFGSGMSLGMTHYP